MKLDINSLDKIWITSDTHAFHVNITRGTSGWGSNGEFKLRDFNTPEEMTAQMADNFNSLIPQDGILFHLGDWSFAGEQNIERFRDMLNVKQIHFISGNHDHHIEWGKWDHLFASRQKYLELEIGEHYSLWIKPDECQNFWNRHHEMKRRKDAGERYWMLMSC